MLRRGGFVLGGWLFAVWQGRGELGWGRRRRNRGGEGRQRGHILTFSDGFTDGFSVGDVVGDSDGKSNKSPYGSGISNPSVIPSAF